MVKGKIFTASIIMIITVVALTASLIAKPNRSDIPSSPKISAPIVSLANHTTAVSNEPELISITTTSEWDPDISPNIDFDTLRYTSLISTKYGDFVRQEKQIIFNESEVARQLSQVGPNTKQLILNYGIFLRTDIH